MLTQQIAQVGKTFALKQLPATEQVWNTAFASSGQARWCGMNTAEKPFAGFLPEQTVSERDGVYLRQAIGLSRTARERGNRPFGSLIGVTARCWGRAGTATASCVTVPRTRKCRPFVMPVSAMAAKRWRVPPLRIGRALCDVCGRHLLGQFAPGGVRH